MARINYVKNVGRFVDFNANPQDAPKKLNLIFGGNGHGKTTLCDIFRSLMCGEGMIVEGRQSLGHDAGAMVSIDIDKEYKYESGAWNGCYSDILVFDEKFIADNVYDGNVINSTTKNNLCAFVLGSENIKYEKVYSKLIAASVDNSLKMKQIENEIVKQTGENISNVKNLVEDADVDNKIKEAQKEIYAIKHIVDLKKKSKPKQIRIKFVKAGQCARLLMKGLLDITNGAEKKFEQHLADHNMTRSGRKWVEEGLGYVAEDSCPFCGQDLSTSEVFNIFSAVFSSEYENTAQIVDALYQQVDELSKNFFPIDDAVDNVVSCSGWNEFVPTKLMEIDFNNELLGPVSKFCKCILGLLEEKRKNISEKITFGNEERNVVKGYLNAQRLLHAYNMNVKYVNKRIDEYLSDKDEGNLKALEHNLKMYSLNKVCFSECVVRLVKEHETFSRRAVKIKKKVSAIKSKITENGRVTFATHMDYVNRLLHDFNAQFVIEKFQSSFVGKKLNSDFGLSLDGHTINVGKSEINKPSFKNTLSSGDKRTLALAFFLSIVQHSRNIEQLVVVFDDPFICFDSSRRSKTIQMIKELADRVRNVFVLSHDCWFVRDIAKTYYRNKTQCYRIKYEEKESTIERVDVSEIINDVLTESHECISSFLNGNEERLVRVSSSLRNLVEGHLKKIYWARISHDAMLGQILTAIRSSLPGDVYSMLNEINNAYTWASHVTQEQMPAVDRIELRNHCEWVMRFVNDVWEFHPALGQSTSSPPPTPSPCQTP